MQRAISLAWSLAWCLCIASLLWLLCDGYVLLTLEHLYAYANNLLARRPSSSVPPEIRWRLGVVLVGLVANGVCCVLIATGLVWGKQRSRSISRLMGCMVLVSLWIAMQLQSEMIGNFGQRIRMVWQLRAIEEFVTELDQALDASPTASDSATSRLALNPHNCYPLAQPKICIFLADQSIPNSHVRVKAVERTPKGAIRLELSGSESGRWLEYRYANDRPRSFEGGLMEHYQLQSSTQIADHWFLVDYKSHSRYDAADPDGAKELSESM